jgi:hypothetical protein
MVAEKNFRTVTSAATLSLILLVTPSANAVRKPHVVGLGASKRVAYSAIGDPAGTAMKENLSPEKSLVIRPLIVDTLLKEWTTGDAHDITERTFTVRRALHINDTLPGEKTQRWVWQRGPWLIIDRTSGKVTALHLPDYDPVVSEVIWFRDYAAYCGLSTTAKPGLFAVVAQVGARKAVLSKKLAAWAADDHATPVCGITGWQRDPMRVTFRPTNMDEVSFDVVGTSAVLVEDDDNSNSE